MWNLLIGPISEVVNTVLKRILPPEKMSESERANLEAQVTMELAKQDWQGVMGNLEINKEEAKSTNWFVAGWRPAVGWVCATAFAYHYIIQPLALFVIITTGVALPPLPTFEMESLMTVLLGMLGLGGLRTFEKYKEVSRG